jgi:hypothetical protein
MIDQLNNRPRWKAAMVLSLPPEIRAAQDPAVAMAEMAATSSPQPTVQSALKSWAGGGSTRRTRAGTAADPGRNGEDLVLKVPVTQITESGGQDGGSAGDAWNTVRRWWWHAAGSGLG